MPDLVEHMYSSHQITIPPTLPTVLKKYAKAAIRTQPRDLLVWSASYFKALTYGIPLPTKERLEYPPVQTISGLSPGYLRVLINQIGNNTIAVLRTDIEAFWKGICLSDEALEEIFSVGGFGIKFNWFKFIAICAGYLESNLTRTMILLCELITDEPSGGSASIPVHKFLYLYKYLARLECGPNELEKEDHHSHQRKITDADIHGISEPFSGDDISYKDEGKIEKSESSISWQSVLKRMGKQETNISESTVNIGGDESITRGIAWQRIAEIEESEPDSSDTIMQSEYYDSSMGVQVFDYTEDKQMKKRLIDPHKLDAEEDQDEDDVEEIKKKAIRSESFVDITRLGEKSLDEMLGIVQEFETTVKVKEKAAALERDEDEEIELKSDSQPLDISPPSGSEVDDENEETEDDELKELVKADSSMILVPTPPVYGEQSEDDDIDKLTEDQEDISSDIKLGLKIGSTSLQDVHIPDFKVPQLLHLEEDIPQTYFQEPKWVPIPGIGPKVPEDQIKEVEIYMKDCAERQAGVVMPRNIRHFQCPPLDIIVPGNMEQSVK